MIVEHNIQATFQVLSEYLQSFLNKDVILQSPTEQEVQQKY